MQKMKWNVQVAHNFVTVLSDNFCTFVWATKSKYAIRLIRMAEDSDKK